VYSPKNSNLRIAALKVSGIFDQNNSAKKPGRSVTNYVCGSMDTKPTPDHFTHILFHELVHLVDDEKGGKKIGDLGKYRDKAMKATHAVRMRNADNFALFATHSHMGTKGSSPVSRR
jgi:hypothetical protein